MTDQAHIPDFDFDGWQALARNSPEEFERQRQETIERLIARGINERQLRGLQCRIDLECAAARTPLKACLRLSSLMWDAFGDLRKKVNDPLKKVDKSSVSGKEDKALNSAKVLSFRRR